MPRLIIIPAAILLLALGCSPLQEDQSHLTALDELPAQYGRLVSVTPHYAKHEWYELWFCDDETGAVTHVPLYRPTWSYNPERVRTITRTPSPADLGGAP